MKKIFLPLFLVFTVGASAQKLFNKLTFTPGQIIEVTTNMNMTTTSMMGEMPASIITVDHYTIGSVAENGIQVTKTPKKIKMNFSMMGQEMNVDSDNPEDLKGQIGEPIKEVMKQKQEFTIDASGKIIAIKKDEKKKSADADMGMLSMLMPGVNTASTVIKEGTPSVFRILPEREIVKGESWTDSLNNEGNQSTMAYTVKDITDNEIIIDYSGEGSTAAKQAAMGMSVDVTANSKSAGTITIDKKTGVLKQKTVVSNSDSKIDLGGREMNSQTKSTTVISFKVL